MSFIIPDEPPPKPTMFALPSFTSILPTGPVGPKIPDKAMKDAITELAEFLAEPAHEIATQLGYEMPGKPPTGGSKVQNPKMPPEQEPMPTETVWK